MKFRLQILALSFVGAFVIHFSVAACGGSAGTSSVTSGDKDAHADTPVATAPACTQWEVKSFLPAGFAFTNLSYKPANGAPETISMPSFDAFSLPAGWEPFAGEGYGATLARHCVAH